MAKTYKILVNDGKGTEIKPVSVVQGAGAKGDPVRMVAKRGWRFELQDDIKGKGLAPDQVRLKRMGKNLAVMFDGSQNADVVIEDFYADNKDDDKDNGMPMLIGQAENGGLYEYVPQDPAASSMPSQLKDGNTPVIASLGGGPLPTDFVLAGLPLVAAGGGLGGWLAGGAAAAAAAAGGGGGGGAGGVLPSGQTGMLKHDAKNDTGKSDQDSLTNNQNPVYTGVAEKGSTVEVTVNGVTYKTVANAADGTYSVELTNKGNVLPDGAYTPTIKVTNATGSSTANGAAFTVDHSTFTEPKPVNPFDSGEVGKTGLRVVINTDENNDGILSSADLPTPASKVTATVALTTDAAVGDILSVSVNGVPAEITLTADHITNGKVVLSGLTPPTEGAVIKVEATIKDAAGNISPSTAQDSATANAATLAVRIQTDENNDGYINKAESDKSSKVSVKVEVPLAVVVGAKINVTDGTTNVEHTLTQAEVDAKSFTLTDAFNKPLEGKNIIVTAKLTGSADATDKAKLDTSSFVDPVKPDPLNPVDAKKSGLRVSIDTDANNDAFLDNAELPADVTKITATIALTKDAAAGDIITVTATGNKTSNITLTEDHITSGKVVLTDLIAPAEGAEIKVTAKIQDAAGNVSPSLAEDSAIASSETPGVEISNDLNNDGFINKDESTPTKISVKVNIPRTAKVGDTVTVSDGGNTSVNHVLTADEVTARSFTLADAFTKPAEGGKITVNAIYNSKQGTDSAVLDTQVPNGGVAPMVTITTDSNPDDGFVNATELNGAQVFNVQATFDKTKVAVGDAVVFTSGGVEHRVVLDTQAKVDAGVATTTYDKPPEGGTLTVSAVIQDTHLNKSASSSDSAVLDTQAPNGGVAPVVKITTDSNPDDGFVNATELSGANVFSVQATFDKTKVAVGDAVVFTSGGVEHKVVLDTQAKVDAGVATTTYDKPPEGGTLTVSAVVQDTHLNKSASSSDSAKLDTTPPVGQTLELKHDEPNDTGVFATDNITTNKAPVLTGFAEKGATVVVKLNGVTYEPITASAVDGSFSLQLSTSKELTSGMWRPEITVTDSVGNSSTTFGTPFTVTEPAAIDVGQSIGMQGQNRGDSVTVNDRIKVTDQDSGEQKISGTLTQVGFFGQIKLNGLATPYDATYVLGQVSDPSEPNDPNQALNALLESRRNTFLTSPGNKVYHDLFTVISYDQSTSETIDVVINQPSASTAEHIYHTSTVAGLKLTGSTNISDTLVLDKQMSFDFSGQAAEANVKGIERVDITGVANSGSANSIKLSLASLMQADVVSAVVNGQPTNVHRLFIDGDANDAVLLNSTLGIQSNHVEPIQGTGVLSGYNVYHFGDAELLIQRSITNITFTG